MLIYLFFSAFAAVLITAYEYLETEEALPPHLEMNSFFSYACYFCVFMYWFLLWPLFFGFVLYRLIREISLQKSHSNSL